MEKKLFAEFEPVTSKQWKQKIQFELNGADYNQNLVWESPEGIKVKPFYHADETQKIVKIDTPPKAEFCETIYVFDIEKTIAKVLKDQENNIKSFVFTLDSAKIELTRVLENINSNATIYINFSFFDLSFLKKIDALAQQKNCIYYCNIDPIGYLAKNGNWYQMPQKDNFEALKDAINSTSNLALLSVTIDLYENAGAHCIQQIAYGLAQITEYFNRVTSVKHPVLICFSVGSNYYFEIAKLRAFRYLFNLLAKEYGVKTPCHLLIYPTKRNKTIYQAIENELKTQAECESGVLGGANAVYNVPFDYLYKKSNFKSATKAKKQLDRTLANCNATQMEGSYFVENLTFEMAEKSLDLFKKIELNGGFLKLLKEGSIQKKIKESADKEQSKFDLDYKFDGIEKIKDQIELYPFLKMNPRKIIVQPVLPRRLAENQEKRQLELE